MTGHLQGVVTRLEKQAQYKLYRMWCGLHQLDLVMHHAYDKLMNGELLTIMNAFIAHLRQQTNLIINMKSTCFKACKSLGSDGQCLYVATGEMYLLVSVSQRRKATANSSRLVVGHHCQPQCIDCASQHRIHQAASKRPSCVTTV